MSEREEGRVGQSLPSEPTFTHSFPQFQSFDRRMSSLSLLILLISIIALSTAFDKNLLKKAKFDVSHKHPISRRVLRFERSVDSFDSNRIDEEFGVPFDFPSLDPHPIESKDSSSSNQFVSQKDLFTLLTPFNEQEVEETNF